MKLFLKIRFSIIFAILSAIYLLLLPSPIGAANAINALAPLPSSVSYENFESYLSSLYNWGISIVGILALVQLIRGGVMYMVSGAVNTKEAAKGIITDALVGLGLALASYLILYTINPNLTTLSTPTLQNTITGTYCSSSNCNLCGSYYCGQNYAGYDATGCEWKKHTTNDCYQCVIDGGTANCTASTESLTSCASNNCGACDTTTCINTSGCKINQMVNPPTCVSN